MAQAMFIDLRGKSKKSALIMVKRNALEYQMHPVYVPVSGLDAVAPDLKKEKGQLFEIPDGFTFAPLVSSEGEVLTAKNGEELHQLVY